MTKKQTELEKCIAWRDELKKDFDEGNQNIVPEDFDYIDWLIDEVGKYEAEND